MTSFAPDPTALAEALAKIATVTDCSESDGDAMLELIFQIRDITRDAIDQYQAAVLAAQKAELAALRAGCA